MNKRTGSTQLLWLVFSLALVAAACGGSAGESGATSEVAPTAVQPTATPAPSPTAKPQPVPEPTATPAPAPSSTPVPAPTAAAHRSTIDELLAMDRPLNIAHAGGDQASPHSTMFAFKEAVAAGADMLELDVQLSADGELVVHHDLTVDGTTGGSGATIDFTVAELQALDNAFWFATECWPCRDLGDDAYLYRGVRTGEHPPPDGYTAEDFRIITLRELVAEFPSMPLNIEVKGEPPQALEVVSALAAVIDELDLATSVIVVSFDDDVVAAFQAAAPGVDTSPGQDELTFWILADVPLTDHRIVQVPPFFETLEIVNEEFIATAAAAGVEVWVWANDASTQENTTFYREMIALGVDGIIAGRPADMESARS